MDIPRIDAVSSLQSVRYGEIDPKERIQQQVLIRAIEQVNRAQVFGARTEVTFGYDRHSEKPVLRIVDRDSGEVVRQIPPEYVLRLSQDLSRD